MESQYLIFKKAFQVRTHVSAHCGGRWSFEFEFETSELPLDKNIKVV